MNRFEQGNSHKFNNFRLVIPIFMFTAMLILFLYGLNSVSSSTYSKQKESLESAINRSIIQCYSVEGFYPPSLDYIIKHYGLIYDDKSFLIDYDYYGDNLRPDVAVIRKSGIKKFIN